MIEKIGILGGGGQADEVESYLPEGTVSFRAVGREYLKPGDVRLVDIASPGVENLSLPIVSAVGAPALRMKLVELWPRDNYRTVVSSAAYVDKTAAIGDGSVVGPGSVISTNVILGSHSIINIGATISHDCRVGNFVTISPGVHVAGRVKIGDGVFIGVGATVSNGVTLAPGVVIGAGAVVLGDISVPNSVAFGVPAKVVKVNDGWLNEL